MLDFARERAREVLNIPRTAVLATDGPAGLQLSEILCHADGLVVYLLLPQTSDHAFNLEHNPAITLLTAAWEMQGKARVVVGREKADLGLLHRPEGEWSVLVQITPSRIHIFGKRGWGNAETIDLSDGQ